jgi:hypothetical protein
VDNKETNKLKSAWRIALGGAHGELIVEDLKFYAKRQAHVPNDPYSTAFNDGLRTMATNILTMIEVEDDVPHETKVLR